MLLHNINENDVESGLGDFGVRKYGDGRFLSIDPLWEKYLAWSPYHYCGNNPINATDANGDEVYAIGDNPDKGIEMINQEFNTLTIIRNAKDGILSYKMNGKMSELSFPESEMMTAINNKKIFLNINFTKDNTMDDINGNKQLVLGGMYGGSKINSNGTVSALQGVNIRHFEKIAKTPNTDRASQNIIHEIIEGYEGALLNPGTTYPQSYPLAHQMSIGIYPLQGTYKVRGEPDPNDRDRMLYFINDIQVLSLPRTYVNIIHDNEPK